MVTISKKMVTLYKSNSMKDASEFVMNAVKNVDKNNLSVMHTIIVPDRASLEAERQLLKTVGGSFNVQVRTFRRLANDILPKYEYLSKQAGIMALSSIVQDNRDKLTCYVKASETAGFVSDMYDTISMMKYCRITPKMLTSVTLSRSIQNKIHDVSLLYQAYLDYSANRFVDSADKMDLLCESISSSDAVKNTYFYLYDFDNLSVQELAVLEQLMKCGLGVTVACCAGKNAHDKYLYLDDIYNSVKAICAQNNIQVNEVEGCRYVNRYAEQIGRNMFRYNDCKPVSADNFVEVFQGATRVQEVYALACRIQKYVRSGGRFKDVYVVTSDVNRYYNAVSTVFDEFDIPYFCDRQFVLSAHPYARFVLDYLQIFRNNGKLTSVLPFVKNHLFCSALPQDEQDDVYLFENYCLKYNVSYRYDEFNLGKNETYYSRANRFRNRFNALYKQVVIPSSDTVENYVKVVRRLIEYAKLNETAERFAKSQEEYGFDFESKTTSQAADKFDQVLAQAEKVLGRRYVKLDEFINTLNMGVEAVKISVLPVSNDCVIFANMAKARKHDVKFLALLGANYGAMPIVKKDSKLLSDANIKDLVACGINFEPQMLTENRRERFSLFQLLQEPTDKLYVSFAEMDGNEALTPSPFVDELYTLFSVNGQKLQPTDIADEDVYTQKQALAKVVLNARKLKDNQAVKMPAFAALSAKYADLCRKYEFTKSGKDVRVEQGADLYLKNSRTSVSQLTDFFKCPYKFYMRYGINVKPREAAKLQSSDLGNILHEVLEIYVRGLDVNEDDSITVAKARQCFEDALSDDFYKGLRADPQMQGTLDQLEEECVRMCQVVKQQLLTSDFTNLATEMSFGAGEEFPPVEVKFDGGKFNLVGKIDRVDVNGDRFIVIDYKSGAAAAHYTESDLYTGHKLQLLVYMQAVLNNHPKLRPAGFYYFNIHNKFARVDAEKVYFYNGRTLNDIDVACAIDKKLRDGKSEKLGIKLSQDKSKIDQRCGSIISDEQFDNQMEYAFKLIANAGELMNNGYAAVSPYKGTCDICDYRDICDFNDAYSYEERKVSKTINKKVIDKTVNK